MGSMASTMPSIHEPWTIAAAPIIGYLRCFMQTHVPTRDLPIPELLRSHCLLRMLIDRQIRYLRFASQPPLAQSRARRHSLVTSSSCCTSGAYLAHRKGVRTVPVKLILQHPTIDGHNVPMPQGDGRRGCRAPLTSLTDVHKEFGKPPYPLNPGSAPWSRMNSSATASSSSNVVTPGRILSATAANVFPTSKELSRRSSTSSSVFMCTRRPKLISGYPVMPPTGDCGRPRNFPDFIKPS